LEETKPETAAQKKAREKAEKEAADKAVADQEEVESASFMGEGESNGEAGSKVETL
jgi:hypothetical protein